MRGYVRQRNRPALHGLLNTLLRISLTIPLLIVIKDNITRSILGFRYSTSLLAISANRLAERPPSKTTDGRREAAPRCFVDEGGVLLSDLR